MRSQAVVIGGGFYGCCLAVRLRRHFAKVVLLEREAALMRRASRINQARLHNGYHYPRSFLTAARSHANFDVFRRHFPEGVVDGFRHLYAIARNDSKVGHRHFERLFASIGVPLQPTQGRFQNLFVPRLIEAVYEVEEPAFNINALRATLIGQLGEAGVDVRLNAEVRQVVARPADAVMDDAIAVELASGADVTASWVFNCTYAGLNRVVATDPASHPQLAHQFTEMALIEPPAELRGLAVTVMDGPFFSVMPFPSEGLYSLSHVRYTPHIRWSEAEHPEYDPLRMVEQWDGRSRYAWMLRDATRYLPALAGARYVKSLFETKTLVTGTQTDDARPILFHRDVRNPRIVSILGGKIDNIFDVYGYVEKALELS